MNTQSTAKWLLSLVLISYSLLLQAQQPSENIRLNQVGFYPNADKIAVVVGEPKDGKFYLKTADGAKTVYTGQLGEVKAAEFSKRPTRVADFSSFSKEGTYVLEVPGMGRSYAFEIKDGVHKEVGAASLKGFYFTRASTALPEEYAGKWHPSAKPIPWYALA